MDPLDLPIRFFILGKTIYLGYPGLWEFRFIISRYSGIWRETEKFVFLKDKSSWLLTAGHQLIFFHNLFLWTTEQNNNNNNKTRDSLAANGPYVSCESPVCKLCPE